MKMVNLRGVEAMAIVATLSNSSIGSGLSVLLMRSSMIVAESLNNSIFYCIKMCRFSNVYVLIDCKVDVYAR